MMDQEIANKEHELLRQAAERRARRWIAAFGGAAILVGALVWYILGNG